MILSDVGGHSLFENNAGNVTMTNYVFTLDYSGDSNALAVNIYCPKDGSKVSEETFTLRGWVDDFTAKMTARVTNAIATNVFEAMLERDGLLWVEDLPLGGGTNTLTLTMTDAAGNVSVTNLSVVQSEVLLAIDNLSHDGNQWRGVSLPFEKQ